MKKLLARLFLLIAFSLLQAFADDAFVGEESRSAIIAVQRYKDLSRPDTELHRAYQLLLGQAVKAKSIVFKDPKWPIIIAAQRKFIFSYGECKCLIPPFFHWAVYKSPVI